MVISNGIKKLNKLLDLLYYKKCPIMNRNKIINGINKILNKITYINCKNVVVVKRVLYMLIFKLKRNNELQDSITCN